MRGPLFCGLSLALCLSSMGQTTRLVPTEFPTIQSAIAASSSGDTVLVSTGIYHESLSFLGRNVKVKSVAGAADTVVDAGLAGRVVTFPGGEGRGALLQGFTLQHGLAPRDASTYRLGSGILVIDASPTILDCTIVDNGDDGTSFEMNVNGGGVYCRGGSPLFVRCRIERNYATSGGGVFLDGSSDTVFEECRFQRNYMNYNIGFRGAAVFCRGSALRIANSHVRNNNGGSAAPGVYATDSELTILDTVLNSNTTDNGDGGALRLENSYAWILRCEIKSNGAFSAAGLLQTGGFVRLEGCAMARNTWLTGQPDPIVSTGTLQVIGTSILESYPRCLNATGPTLVANSILWSTMAPAPGRNVIAGTPSVYYSLVRGGHSGTGNLDIDPAFVDGTIADLRLQASSPCIDQGSMGFPISATDLDGNPRWVGAKPDVGCDEFDVSLAVQYPIAAPATVRFGVVGAPGSSAILGFSLQPTLLDPPLVFPGFEGALYLRDPVHFFALGTLPASGYLGIEAYASSGPLVLPVQALVNLRFTNPKVVSLDG